MTEQYHIDLDHLSAEETEIFYQRYLREGATILVKDYNLKPSLATRLFGLFPTDKCHAACGNCSENELFAKKISKKEFNDPASTMRIAECILCDHKQYVSEDLTTVLSSLENCACESCQAMRSLKQQQQLDAAEQEHREKSRKIIEEHTIERRYIPFSESNENYNLSAVVMLMAMMFARWNNIYDRKKDDDFIAPYNSGEIPLYPERVNSPSHPLIRCIFDKVVFFDLKRCKINDFVIEDNGSVSFYSRQLHFQTNFTDDCGDDLSIPQTYEWLSRKFTDRYWYTNWNEQLLNVWLDLGVCECIEYARSKAEEYSFSFSSEEKISEIIRDLLHRHSVSECFYFISTAYWTAAAFLQSNKSSGRKHAENIVPGKILALANSGQSKKWDRPSSLPRSTFSLILFDVMLDTKNDAGFNLCPGKSYLELLSKVKVQWPEIEEEPVSIDITGEIGLYDLFSFLSQANFEESTDSVEKQLAHLTLIAQALGLNKAALTLRDVLLSEYDIEYCEEIKR